jgi:hypothetical protein
VAVDMEARIFGTEAVKILRLLNSWGGTSGSDGGILGWSKLGVKWRGVLCENTYTWRPDCPRP